MKYCFDAGKYQKASAHQQDWGLRMISELSLSGNERILDLGCGDGRLTKRLAELTPNGSVLGLDSSSQMIEAAKALERGNLSFICKDVCEMDYECEFDLIYSNAALHWVKDHMGLLASCRKALNSGGLIRWSFGGEGNTKNLVAALNGAISKSGAFSGFDWPWFFSLC
jgi:trans-aconitate methyltransferase